MATLENARMPSLRDKQLAEMTNEEIVAETKALKKESKEKVAKKK